MSLTQQSSSLYELVLKDRSSIKYTRGLWLPGYPDSLLLPNTTPRPRTLVSSPQSESGSEYLPDSSPNANTFWAVWLEHTWVQFDWLEKILVATNDLNDGSLRLKYVADDRAAAESFSVIRQARSLIYHTDGWFG
jgi:hypothetical protein